MRSKKKKGLKCFEGAIAFFNSLKGAIFKNSLENPAENELKFWLSCY